MEQRTGTTEHAKNPRNCYQTCQALGIVGGSGGGRVSAYQCEAAGDGEGAGDDVSGHRWARTELGSPGLPCAARLVALPPVGEGRGREKHALICSTRYALPSVSPRRRAAGPCRSPERDRSGRERR
jgi:hypothetical protein